MDYSIISPSWFWRYKDHWMFKRHEPVLLTSWSLGTNRKIVCPIYASEDTGINFDIAKNQIRRNFMIKKSKPLLKVKLKLFPGKRKKTNIKHYLFSRH